MSFQIIRAAIKNRRINQYMMAALLGACMFAGAATGGEHRASENYVMQIDAAAKQRMGEQTFNEVAAFFAAAEEAIETKDLQTLMALYSDNYTDGEHDKKSAEQIWKRIFARFDGMATHHNMKLMTVSVDKNMVVLSCSGLLLGAADPDNRFVTIDNWTLQNHVLVKEAGKWQLIGTYGKDRTRLWFDKPMHPLF